MRTDLLWLPSEITWLATPIIGQSSSRSLNYSGDAGYHKLLTELGAHKYFSIAEWLAYPEGYASKRNTLEEIYLLGFGRLVGA